jgi:hypothetical protein
MVDLHPLTEQQVEAGGRRIGVIEEPDFVTAHLPNAEAPLEERRGGPSTASNHSPEPSSPSMRRVIARYARVFPARGVVLRFMRSSRA